MLRFGGAASDCAGTTRRNFVQAGLAGLGRSIPQIKSVQLHNFGDDIAIEGYLRDPYE